MFSIAIVSNNVSKLPLLFDRDSEMLKNYGTEFYLQAAVNLNKNVVFYLPVLCPVIG